MNEEKTKVEQTPIVKEDFLDKEDIMYPESQTVLFRTSSK